MSIKTRQDSTPIRWYFADYIQESLGGSVNIVKERQLDIWYNIGTDYVLMLFLTAIARRFLHDGMSWQKLEVYKVGEGEQYCAHLALASEAYGGDLKVQFFRADNYPLPVKKIILNKNKKRTTTKQKVKKNGSKRTKETCADPEISG